MQKLDPFSVFFLTSLSFISACLPCCSPNFLYYGVAIVVGVGQFDEGGVGCSRRVVELEFFGRDKSWY